MYQASVTSLNGRKETYIGLARNFKKRYGNHKSSLLNKKEEGKTTLSSHFWREKDAGQKPRVDWKILEKNIPDFNPTTGVCKLCLREKHYILFEPKK